MKTRVVALADGEAITHVREISSEVQLYSLQEAKVWSGVEGSSAQ